MSDVHEFDSAEEAIEYFKNQGVCNPQTAIYFLAKDGLIKIRKNKKEEVENK